MRLQTTSHPPNKACTGPTAGEAAVRRACPELSRIFHKNDGKLKALR